MVCPTKLQLRITFSVQLPALVHIHCGVSMKAASPHLSPPTAKEFLVYFHSTVFLTKQFFSSSSAEPHVYNLSHIFPTLHPLLKSSTPLLLTFLHVDSNLFQWKLCMPFSHEMTIWPPCPIPDCLIVFVIVLQVSSSPLIQVQVPGSCSFSCNIQLPQYHPILSLICLFPCVSVYFPSFTTSFLLLCSSFSFHNTIILQSFLS